MHTNGSENDIRCQVTKRKVSGGTRSDVGRDCRDAFLGLAKTCAKLGIGFWDYLGDRLAVPGRHRTSRSCRFARQRSLPIAVIARTFATVTLSLCQADELDDDLGLTPLCIAPPYHGA